MSTAHLSVTRPRWQRVLSVAAVSFLSLSVLHADPDERVTVEEQFLGSSEKGFAVLRTELENQDMYNSRTRRFLDEYVKTGDESRGLAERSRSTLLLDVSTVIDASHDDPLTAPKTEKVHGKNKSVIFTDILTKYPQRPEKWSAEWYMKLSTDQARGMSVGHFNFLSGGTITEKVFGFPKDEAAEAEWTLDGVMQDSNGVYLTVSTDTDYSCQTRIVGILPRRSRQIQDHLSLQPKYLSAGQFATREEAVKTAHALIRKSHESGGDPVSPEIWTMSKDAGKTMHVLTFGAMNDDTTQDFIAALEKSIGVRLHPQSSEGFLERMAVSEPAPAPPQKAGNAAPSPASPR